MFNTYQEHLDHVTNAEYDYLSEAFGETARDCRRMAEMDAMDAYCDGCIDKQDDIEARGPSVTRPYANDILY